MTVKITKPRKPWKDIDHLATPANIAKYEFACCKDCIYRKLALHIRPKPIKAGPCYWIIKDGKPVNFINFKRKGEKQ